MNKVVGKRVINSTVVDLNKQKKSKLVKLKMEISLLSITVQHQTKKLKLQT
jgi:hypothetical protein